MVRPASTNWPVGVQNSKTMEGERGHQGIKVLKVIKSYNGRTSELRSTKNECTKMTGIELGMELKKIRKDY